MEKLTFEKAKENKFNWIKCVQYYFPEMSDEQADYVIWNETCFPFDDDTTLEQLYTKFLNEAKNGKRSEAE